MIVYCLGLQASGSTWLYNVVRSILAAAGVDHTALRVEEVKDLDSPLLHRTRHVVMRGHNISSALLRFLQAAEARTLLSFRDPRDCVTSSMQRFGRKLVPVCNDIVRNLASLHTARLALPSLAFVYEDQFTATPATVLRCADFLGLPITAAQAAAIFDAFKVEAVLARFARTDGAAAATFVNDVTGSEVDIHTSFHRNHISDGRTGKWRDRLDPAARDAVQTLFQDGAAWHGDDGGRLGLTFTSTLFRPVDSMLDYRRALSVAELTSPLGVKVLSDVYLPRGIWRLRLSIAAAAGVPMGALDVLACQDGQVIHRAEAAADGCEYVWMNIVHDHPFDFHLSGARLDELPPDAPPPVCQLHATLLYDDAALRPGITDTGLVRPPPAAALFAAPRGGDAPGGLDGGQLALRRIVLLHRALRRPGTLVDIGAYCGDVGLSVTADGGAALVAVEPLAEAAIELRRRAGRRAVRVIEAALGEPGATDARLQVPLLHGAPVWPWASTVNDFAALVRDRPEITGTLSLKVRALSLDALALRDVAAIHLNAQGAEAAVLRGARQTLLRHRPLLTLEIEERHAPGVTRLVPEWLAELDYDGFFEVDGEAWPIAGFDPATLQISGRSPADDSYSDPYVNCFYFLPRADTALRERFHAIYGGRAAGRPAVAADRDRDPALMPTQ